MSEYQYYEFTAIDKPLTPKQVEEVEQFSSRADVTSTRFVNEYNYGNFRGNPDHFLRDYFDAMVYIANWGTRQFMFRVPKDLVDQQAMRAFEWPDMLELRSAGVHWIVDLSLQEDGGDYVEGHGLMRSLAGVRAEVLGGDLRPLLIGWLAGVTQGGCGSDDEDLDDDPVPPTPPGMNKLTASQQALAEFLDVDETLLKLAGAGSVPPPAEPDLAQALAKFPTTQKERWLLELLTSDDPQAAKRIIRQVRPTREFPAAEPSFKTVGDLRRAWGELERKQTADQQARAAAVKRKKDAEDAAAYQLRLDRLATRGDSVWTEIDSLITMRNEQTYKQAVTLLKDLRALAGRTGKDADFSDRVQKLLQAHGRKGNFVQLARRSGIA
jgi:hypothetical protein